MNTWNRVAFKKAANVLHKKITVKALKEIGSRAFGNIIFVYLRASVRLKCLEREREQ